jgi:hypothetical protein
MREPIERRREARDRHGGEHATGAQDAPRLRQRRQSRSAIDQVIQRAEQQRRVDTGIGARQPTSVSHARSQPHALLARVRAPARHVARRDLATPPRSPRRPAAPHGHHPHRRHRPRSPAVTAGSATAAPACVRTRAGHRARAAGGAQPRAGSSERYRDRAPYPATILRQSWLRRNASDETPAPHQPAVTPGSRAPCSRSARSPGQADRSLSRQAQVGRCSPSLSTEFVCRCNAWRRMGGLALLASRPNQARDGWRAERSRCVSEQKSRPSRGDRRAGTPSVPRRRSYDVTGRWKR